MTGQSEIRLDPVAQTIAHDEKSVALPHLSYLLLDLLAEHRPDPVSFADIEETVWGAQVTRETIKQRISLLRKSLADVGLDEQAIVAVPSIGYRLALSAPLLKDDPAPANRRGPMVAIIAGLAVLILALSLFLRAEPVQDDTTRIVVVNEATNVGGSAHLAWLEQNRALSGQLAELQGVATIATISRTDIDATRSRDTAIELGSDLIISSALVERQGKPQISYQLIDGRNEEILWSGDYDAEGETAMRAGAHILKNINEALLARGKSVERSAPDRSVSLYYLALDIVRVPDRENLEMAIAQLDEALTIAPDFPLALALRGRAKADLVLRYGADSSLATEALRDSRMAKTLAPNVAEIDYAIARSLWAAGDEEAALEAMNRAAYYLPYLDREIAAIQGELDRVQPR